MTVPIHSVRRMSKLPAELLLQWDMPLWRLRKGGLPENLQVEASASEKMPEKPAKTPENRVFSGVFVPETLSALADTLLRNMQKAFPQFPTARFIYDEVEALLAAETGSVPVFGEPEWLEDAQDLPVTVVALPDLEAMLEDPLLKKQCYVVLLKHFHEAV